MSDAMLFDETPSAAPTPPRAPWEVLVVDDDPDILRITEVSLARLTVDGAPLRLTCCESGAAARALLSPADARFAVVLLDVIMETEDAGLQVARWLRDVRGDALTRVLIRTGQPGMFDAKSVIAAYDLHDYLTKVEVSHTRLSTSVAAAVRAWRDLRALSLVRASLDDLLRAASTAPLDAQVVTAALVAQVAALLTPGTSIALVRSAPGPSVATVYAGAGRFSAGDPCPPTERDTLELRTLLDGGALALAVSADAPLTPHDRALCVRCLDAAHTLLEDTIQKSAR